jgi:NTP pyrophosphatase (non-canonical NTP hydrolase)
MMLQRCMEVKQQIVADALTPRESNMKLLISQVEGWAMARKIIPNSTPMAQLLKTMSELGELADATLKSDEEGVIDGVGDVLITLIIYAALQGLTIEHCLREAYEQIKDRKGTLTPEGVFVKEEA